MVGGGTLNRGPEGGNLCMVMTNSEQVGLRAVEGLKL